MTPYSNVTNRFIRKIKKDKEFFCYKNVTEEEIVEVITQRGNELLDDSVNDIQLKIAFEQEVDFLDKDDTLEQFNFKLTTIEEDLLSDLMVCKYLDEELVQFKAMQKYLGSDIKLFSPANERKTFIQMIDHRHRKFEAKLDSYNSRNRLTGKVLLPYE
ncbi:MAG: hypothetical protein ACRCX8_18960 [Sarcina sp.]